MDYATTLVAAVLLGIGFVLQQYAARQEPECRFLSPRIITDLLRKPRWLIGIACMVAGQLLAAWSIGHSALTLVEPLLTTYLLFALILAVPMSRQPVRWSEVTGALILIVGVTLLSLSRSTKPIGLSFGSFSHWPAAAAIAAIAIICVHAGRRREGRMRALLTGIAAGLVYGIQDALTRQTLEALQSGGISGMLSTWAPYALVGAGAIGIWLMQSAFSAGPIQMSLPAISAGEPLVGILLGIIVFGDRIQVVRRNIHFKAPNGTPLDKAVKQNYTDSVLMALPILALNPMRGGSVLIDFSDIFLTDFGQLGLGFLDRSRSRWAKVKGFPNNMELEVEATFTGGGRRPWSNYHDGVADHRGITVVLHYSLMRTPDYGYHPRHADDRVGHFLRIQVDGDIDASRTQHFEQMRHKFGDGHGRQVAVTRRSPTSCTSHLMGDQVNSDFIRAAIVRNRPRYETTAAEPKRHLAPLRFERLGQLQLTHGLQSHMQKMLGGREIGIAKSGPGIVRDVLG